MGVLWMCVYDHVWCVDLGFINNHSNDDESVVSGIVLNLSLLLCSVHGVLHIQPHTFHDISIT